MKSLKLDPWHRSDGEIWDSDLKLLMAMASLQTVGEYAVEIGTLYGRTTVNLARAMPRHKIITVDIPSGVKPALTIDPNDEKFIGHPEHEPWPDDIADRITEIRCDSAKLSLDIPYGSVGLAVIDGSHSFEYAANDAQRMFPYMAKDSLMFFHDYREWPGVTQFIDAFVEETRQSCSKTKWTHIEGSLFAIAKFW